MAKTRSSDAATEGPVANSISATSPTASRAGTKRSATTEDQSKKRQRTDDRDQIGARRAKSANFAVVINSTPSHQPQKTDNIHKAQEQPTSSKVVADSVDGDDLSMENEDSEDGVKLTEAGSNAIEISSGDEEEDADDDDTQMIDAMSSQPLAHTKSNHIRFDSASPDMDDAWQAPKPTQEPQVEVSEQDDSGDEAPEEVAAPDAQASSKSLAANAVKAVERQRAKVKKQRQERDAQLKKQSKGALSSKRSLLGTSEDVPVENKTIKSRRDAGNLPDLLPDDVLAEEPSVRPISPLPEDKIFKVLNVSRRKPIKFEDDVAKDVIKGPVSVSVTHKSNKFLPPKAGNSKSIKDAWLSGKHGQSSVSHERKKIGRGFLRK